MALLIRFDDLLSESLLAVIRYIKSDTGAEPNQEELAQVLGSYFIVNEIGNQLKYQKKRQRGADPTSDSHQELGRSRWNFNLITGPPLNNLARAGLFIGPVGEAIDQIRTYAQQVAGADITDGDVASSLRSSFILSEIVNQVKWARQEAAGSKNQNLTLPENAPPARNK